MIEFQAAFISRPRVTEENGIPIQWELNWVRRQLHIQSDLKRMANMDGLLVADGMQHIGYVVGL